MDARSGPDAKERLREPSDVPHWLRTHARHAASLRAGLWCILTPQEGSRGWCVTTLNSVTLGRFIAWPIEPSLGAVRQPKKTGGHHVKNICNVIYSRVSHWPQTTPHADASDPRFVRPPRGSPRPEAGLVYTGASTRMVPAIGRRCHRPLRNCNGFPERAFERMRPRGVERPRGRCGATVPGAALGACGLQARSCSRTVSYTKRLSHLSQSGSAWRSRAGRAPGLAVRGVRRAPRMTARPPYRCPPAGLLRPRCLHRQCGSG